MGSRPLHMWPFVCVSSFLSPGMGYPADIDRDKGPSRPVMLDILHTIPHPLKSNRTIFN